MASKSQLERELQEYATLKDNLLATASNLQNANSNVNKLGPIITDNYTIDKRPSLVRERIDKMAEDISETSNYIRNTIIPAIDEKMEDIYEEINRLEEEERSAHEVAEKKAIPNSQRASSITFRW